MRFRRATRGCPGSTQEVSNEEEWSESVKSPGNLLCGLYAGYVLAIDSAVEKWTE